MVMRMRALVWCFGMLLALCGTASVGFAEAGYSEAVVDINSADATTLATALPGIGPVKAAAIVAWREANGSFRSLDQLIEVRGIGPKTLEALRGQVRLGALRRSTAEESHSLPDAASSGAASSSATSPDAASSGAPSPDAASSGAVSIDAREPESSAEEPDWHAKVMVRRALHARPPWGGETATQR